MGTISIASPLAATMVVVYFITHKLVLVCGKSVMYGFNFMFKNIDFVTFLTDKSLLGEM